MSAEVGRRYCGREFSVADLAHIRQLLALQPALGRVALSRRLCQDVGWLNALGQPKEMSARVALLRMEKDGLIRLPAPLSQNGRGQRRFQLTAASAPQEPVRQALQALDFFSHNRCAIESIADRNFHFFAEDKRERLRIIKISAGEKQF